MASKVDIFNLALSVLGDDTVLLPDQATEQARSLAAIYDTIRDATLTAHPWNFAMARKSLPAESATPEWGFDQQFALPSDPFCLRVWRANGRRTGWRVEGRKILANAEAPLQILYIARIEDTELFSFTFIDALAAHLAGTVAYKRTQSRAKESDAWGVYEKKLVLARSIDGQEGDPEQPLTDSFLGSRI